MVYKYLMESNMFKKILRVIFKIPLTPIIMFYFVSMILMSYIEQFFEWLYDASDFSKSVTQDVQDDFYHGLKKWFTTI